MLNGIDGQKHLVSRESELRGGLKSQGVRRGKQRGRAEEVVYRSIEPPDL